MNALTLAGLAGAGIVGDVDEAIAALDLGAAEAALDEAVLGEERGMLKRPGIDPPEGEQLEEAVLREKTDVKRPGIASSNDPKRNN